MIIACPKCETSFSLPDELYKPGKKARCSQCGNVFPMPVQETEAAEEEFRPASGDALAPAAPAPVSAPAWKKRLPLLIASAGVCLLFVLGYGGFLMYRSFTATKPAPVAAAPEKPAESKAQPIDSVSLDEVRQFMVDNAKIGRIVVIQGVAVNISKTPKEYIVIKARLMDAGQRVLSEVEQVAGVPLTLFQLQYLSEAELKETLGNRIAILTNNTNIPPGGKVSFAVVFTKVPESMRTFDLNVVSVRESTAR